MIDVLIVGAGPTGLTLACELARRGVAHRIVERSPRPFDGSRAKGLQPRTLEVLDDLGLVDRVLAAGALYPSLLVHLGGEATHETRMDELHDARPDVPYPNIWMLPQWRTGELLAERLAELGGQVELGVEVTGFTQDADGVTATLSTGETLRAGYLVGADGGRSAVRRALGVGSRARPTRPSGSPSPTSGSPGSTATTGTSGRARTAARSGWACARCRAATGTSSTRRRPRTPRPSPPTRSSPS